MPSSTVSSSKNTSTKTFHKESKTTTSFSSSYQESRTVTTTHYSRKVTSSAQVSRALYLDVQSARRTNGVALNRTVGGAIVPRLPASALVRHTKTVTPDHREGNRGVSFSCDVAIEEKPSTGDIKSSSPHEPLLQEESVTVHSKSSKKVEDPPHTNGKKLEKDAAFKKEQTRRFKENHLSTLVGPVKGLKKWEVKKLPKSKCKDGHSPNWFAYGANVYALDNVHKRGFMPNIYGPPEHHLESGEIVFELDRTVDDRATWIKHKFWSRETKRWRTGWTKANWMNRVQPSGILHKSQSYQGR